MGKTVFDFGAKGDGTTDDSGAFSAALQASATGIGPVIVPAATYKINHTIAYSSKGNVGQPWGLLGQGALLVSGITNGSDVMQLTSNNTVRYFQLSNLKIQGSGSDGYGLHLFCPTAALYFYDIVIDGLYVEGAGKDGMLFEGNVFEAVVRDSYFQDNKGNGATFAHSKGGDCSCIRVRDCFFMQNGNYGLLATTFDAQYGGCRDVAVFGGYMRENKSYGAYFNNGVDIPLDGVGFENNCKKLAVGDRTGAHVYSLTDMKMNNCVGYVNSGGSTYLLAGWWLANCYLNKCAMSVEGAPANYSGLVLLNGSNAGYVLMTECAGGLDYSSGNQAFFRGNNCAGSTPIGALNPYGSVGTK